MLLNFIPSLSSSIRVTGWLRGALAVALWCLGAVLSPAAAQTGTTDTAKSAARAASARTATGTVPARSTRTTGGPAWSDLTAAQQQSLQPLAAQWSSLSEAQKRKWLAMARNYAKLPPPEQAMLHSRMAEWVALSPRQRTEARLNFADTRQLSPGDKRAQWEAYQALSPEEKQKLAAHAAPKPGGAATAVKPVPAQKLAKVPKPPGDPKETARPAVAARQVDHNTLLPKPAASQPPVSPPRN